jgi:hypothetical protein
VTTTLAAAVLATTVRLMASHAYAEGAPPGFSGGFKEDSCHACHFHAEVNAPGGRVTIEGVPERFADGERYTLIVTLTRTGMKRAGFQLAARFKDSGAQAGTLAPGSGERERVAVERQGGVQYAGHKQAGSSVGGADAARWTIEWTAPKRGGPVMFHVSANAADGNDSADGDFVYTDSREAVADNPAARALRDTNAPNFVFLRNSWRVSVTRKHRFSNTARRSGLRLRRAVFFVDDAVA